MKIGKFFTVLAVALICSSVSVVADSHEPFLENGRVLLKEKKYQEALEQFQKAFNEQPDNLDVNYFLGVTYSALKDYENAFMAFDRMLIVDEELGRAKLELARCCYHLKLYDLAEQYFNDALKVGLPPNVEENVRVFLSRISSDRRHHYFTGKLTLSVANDSNLTLSPNAVVPFDNGFPVTLGKEEGWAFSQSLDLRHEYRYFMEAPHVWASDFFVHNTIYDTKYDVPGSDELGLDLTYYRLRTGPRFNFENCSWDIKAVGNYIYSSYEDFMRSLGVTTGLSYSLSDNVWLASSITAEKRKFFENKGMDGNNYKLTLGPTILYGKNMYSLTGGFEYHGADDDSYKFKRYNISLFYLRQLPWQMNFTVGYRYDDTKYDDDHVSFGDKQEDRLKRWTVSLSKLITSDLLVQLTYRNSRNDSSLDAYNYERHETVLSMIYSF